MPKKKVEPTQYITRQEFDEAMILIHSAFERVVTKDEFQEFRSEMGEFRAEMYEFKKKMGKFEISVQKSLESIMHVVQLIDAQLKEHRDIPKRVASLEEDVFEHDMALRRLQAK